MLIQLLSKCVTEQEIEIQQVFLHVTDTAPHYNSDYPVTHDFERPEKQQLTGKKSSTIYQPILSYPILNIACSKIRPSKQLAHLTASSYEQLGINIVIPICNCRTNLLHYTIKNPDKMKYNSYILEVQSGSVAKVRRLSAHPAPGRITASSYIG